MLQFLVVLMQGSVVSRRSPTVVRKWEARAVWRVGPGRLVKADAGGRSIVFGPHPCVRRRAAWATASTKIYRDGPVSHEIAIYIHPVARPLCVSQVPPPSPVLPSHCLIVGRCVNSTRELLPDTTPASRSCPCPAAPQYKLRRASSDGNRLCSRVRWAAVSTLPDAFYCLDDPPREHAS
jgi:hypothetical protein